MGAKGMFSMPWGALKELWGGIRGQSCKKTALEDHQARDGTAKCGLFVAGSRGKFPINQLGETGATGMLAIILVCILGLRATSSLCAPLQQLSHPSECLSPGRKKEV